ncbi:hypothetical protein BDQ17DRAFT_1422321 [Cyathus striatus]|nr:hypothetical protein BDQ17DRAFT_1422321 [Cyathus striatus]
MFSAATTSARRAISSTMSVQNRSLIEIGVIFFAIGTITNVLAMRFFGNDGTDSSKFDSGSVALIGAIGGLLSAAFYALAKCSLLSMLRKRFPGLGYCWAIFLLSAMYLQTDSSTAGFIGGKILNWIRVEPKVYDASDLGYRGGSRILIMVMLLLQILALPYLIYSNVTGARDSAAEDKIILPS